MFLSRVGCDNNARSCTSIANRANDTPFYVIRGLEPKTNLITLIHVIDRFYSMLISIALSYFLTHRINSCIYAYITIFT